MRVRVRGHESSWVLVRSGVPQGSVLGLLLFLLYVNELPTWIRSSIAMFADDTKIWRKISKVENARLLQDDLDKIRTWTKTSLMDFNVDKCKVMHVNHSLGTSYTLERDGKNCRLLEVREERDLGVMVRSDLKVELQCEKAAAKASSVLGLINRHFKDLLI